MEADFEERDAITRLLDHLIEDERRVLLQDLPPELQPVDEPEDAATATE